jgi:hypothetical protein
MKCRRMRWAGMQHEWGGEECVEYIDFKIRKKGSLGIRRRRREDDIKMGLREIG